MENKKVGYLLIGVSIVMVLIILIFNSALTEIVKASCTTVGHGESCPMYDTITKQTYLALSLVLILVIIAIILMFSKPDIVVKEIEKERPKRIISKAGLKEEEIKVLDLIQENKAMFQADIIEKTGFGKAKVTRIIDRLEGKGYAERKRRGMNNIIVFKEE